MYSLAGLYVHLIFFKYLRGSENHNFDEIGTAVQKLRLFQKSHPYVKEAVFRQYVFNL